MNILPITYFNSLNLRKQTQNRSSMINGNFGLRLQTSPKSDTVSFKNTPKKLVDRRNAISRAVASDINKLALERQYKVYDYLNSLYGSLVATKYTPENIIYGLFGRAKSTDSIIEKSATRGWYTKADILKNMTDLNGGKIILRDGSRKGVNIILDMLTESIRNGDVDLIEIENKRPIAAKKLKGYKAFQYDYAAPEKLEAMRDLTDKIHPSEKVNYIPVDYTESNYPALHFLLKLPGEDWCFELQLMGYDVDLYKNLDDLIYKVLNNKNIDKQFKKIEDIVAPLNEPGNIKLKEQFNRYRSNVFLFQRAKAPHIRKNEQYVERFLPISDEIEDGDLRQVLDMNNLYSIYLDCIKKKSTKK